jgi:Asp-tRNA(Asn)/Glu-tRNA(Gln) amidotransferase A subunit family amidase
MSVGERALLSMPAREFPAYTRRLPRMGFADSEKYRARMYEDMRAIFTRYRLLITPSAALPGVAADLPVEGPPLTIDHRQVDPVWGWYLSYPFNMLGHLPSASVPCGQTASGIPNGVQVVGRPYDEASVLRASAALERVRPAGRPVIV